MYHSDDAADYQPQWQTAIRLHQDLKLSIAPVRPGKKWPDKWKHYQDPARRPTADTVRHWAEFNADWNYCIFTGRASGIVVVEADDDTADLAIRQRCRETPLVQVSGSDKRSRHYVYRYPSTLPDGWAKIPTRSKLLGLNLDIRGDGGLIVGPGSLRTDTGRRYQEVNPWTAERLAAAPEFDPSWLGLDTPRSPARATYQRTDVDLSDKQRAAQQWLERRKGAVQGQGADNYCYATAAAVQHDFDLTPDEAFPVLMDWGQRPDQVDDKGGWYPWDEAEIWHKLEDTDGLDDDDGKPRGWRLGDVQRAEFERQYSARRQVTISDIGAGLPDGLKVSNPAPVVWRVPSVLHYISRGRDDYEWLIPGKMRRGVLAMMPAASKSGKTTLLYNTALDVIVEGMAWGVACERFPIVHLDWENDPTFIKNNMFKPRALSPEQLETAGQWFYATDPTDPDPALRLPPHITTEYLTEIAGQFKQPGLIAVDTMRGAWAAHAVNNVEGWDFKGAVIRNLLHPYLAFCRKTGWTLLILHHTNRAGRSYGSVDFEAVADQIYTLTRDVDHLGRDTSYATMEIKGRPGADDLKFVMTDGVYHCLGTSHEARNHQQADDVNKVVAALKDKPGMGAQEIRKATGIPDLRCRDVVARLTDFKVLTSLGYNKGYSLSTGWQLRLANLPG